MNNGRIGDLSHDLAVLSFSGPDALHFLQGQLSQDVSSLQADNALWAAYINPKGRVWATGLLYLANHDTVYWIVRRSIASSLAQRLRLFILRTKVSIQHEDIALQAYAPSRTWEGVLRAPLPRDGNCVQLGEGLGIAIGDHAISHLPESQLLSSDQWWQLQMQQGWVWLDQSVSQVFLAQSLNLDCTGAIHFRKGCYPGQEVVARSHYRGTLKRRMVLAQYTGSTPERNALVYLEGASTEVDQAVGQIIDVAPWSKLALFEVQLSALAKDAIFCTAEGARFTQKALPYPLDKPV